MPARRRAPGPRRQPTTLAPTSVGAPMRLMSTLADCQAIRVPATTNVPRVLISADPLDLGQLGRRRRRRVPLVLPPGAAIPGGRRATSPQRDRRPRGLHRTWSSWDVLPRGPRPDAGVVGRPVRSGPARRCSATTACGGCSTRRPHARVTACGTSASASAESDDLVTWRQVGDLTAAGRRPALVPDPARRTSTASETWRDPTGSSATPTATAGTCSSPPVPSPTDPTTTASSPTRAAHDLRHWELGPARVRVRVRLRPARGGPGPADRRPLGRWCSPATRRR